jgi:Tfp pilus assembly protein PilN
MAVELNFARKKKKKTFPFLGILSLSILALIPSAVIHGRYFLEEKDLKKRLVEIEDLLSRERIVQEWKKTESEIRSLEKKVEVISSATSRGQFWPPFFRSLSRVIPDDTWITRIGKAEKEGGFEIEGRSVTLKSVPVFVKNLRSLRSVTSCDIKSVDSDGNRHRFILTIHFAEGE